VLAVACVQPAGDVRAWGVKGGRDGRIFSGRVQREQVLAVACVQQAGGVHAWVVKGGRVFRVFSGLILGTVSGAGLCVVMQMLVDPWPGVLTTSMLVAVHTMDPLLDVSSHGNSDRLSGYWPVHSRPHPCTTANMGTHCS
jgi:hypothetical protein